MDMNFDEGYERSIVTELLKRIEDATCVALQYGMIDGEHHKQWVIDQILRALNSGAYSELMKAYDYGDDYTPNRGT